MVNGIRACDHLGLNKGCGSMLPVGSRVRLQAPEEGWRICRTKRCEYINKEEDNDPKILNDKKNTPAIRPQKFPWDRLIPV